MAQVTVLFSSKWGQTQKIAGRIAERLRGEGHAVILADARHLPREEVLAQQQGFVIGSWVRGGRYTRATYRFVRKHRELLSGVPSAFFSVSLLQLSTRAESRARAEAYVPQFLRETDWHPRLTAVFAGAMTYTRLGWLGKRIMRAIWRREGMDADTARDFEYTRWEEVDRFADAFAAMLPSAAPEASSREEVPVGSSVADGA